MILPLGLQVEDAGHLRGLDGGKTLSFSLVQLPHVDLLTCERIVWCPLSTLAVPSIHGEENKARDLGSNAWRIRSQSQVDRQVKVTSQEHLIDSKPTEYAKTL
jgi:hypothetical protein